MKTVIYSSGLILLLAAAGCRKEEQAPPTPTKTPMETGRFTALTKMPLSRTGAVSFTVKGCLYIGCGNNYGAYKRDLFRYDPQTAVWTQEASMPAQAAERTCAAAFVIDSNAYVGMGICYNGAVLNDFWQYSPATNTWTAKASFPGTHRVNNLAFSTGGYGYAGLGCNNLTYYSHSNAMFRYDPQSNTWTGRANGPQLSGFESHCFSIGNRVFVSDDRYVNSAGHTLYEYDAVQDAWSSRKGLPSYKTALDPEIAVKNTFSVNGEAYLVSAFLTTGNGYSYSQDRLLVHRYNPDTDEWKMVVLTSQTYTIFGPNAHCVAIGSWVYVHHEATNYVMDGNFWKFQPQQLGL